MQSTWLNGSVPLLTTLLLLATAAGTGYARPLPEKISTAWKDAGAIVGWMRVDKTGYPFVALSRKRVRWADEWWHAPAASSAA